MPSRGTSRLVLLLLVAAFAACSTESTGSPDAALCEPESAEELCQAQGKDCQRIQATDRCGQDRDVHCGFCATGKTCVSGVCTADTHETNCTDAVDSDADGMTDCADSDCATASACAPPPPKPCSRQSICGDIVDEMVTDVCLGGYCKAPGAATYRGDAITSQVGIRLVVGGTLTGSSKPQSAVVRFVDSRRPDGSTINCSQLQALGNCKDATTRSRIDDDPKVNQVFRSAYAFDFSSCVDSECVFPKFALIPQGQSYVLYGEAWSGARELNDPTGTCVASYCLDGQTVDANKTFQIAFH
ncbi:MAG: hypothetical protein QM765_47805 [Myxococcales bacterium]